MYNIKNNTNFQALLFIQSEYISLPENFTFLFLNVSLKALKKSLNLREAD